MPLGERKGLVTKENPSTPVEFQSNLRASEFSYGFLDIIYFYGCICFVGYYNSNISCRNLNN